MKKNLRIVSAAAAALLAVAPVAASAVSVNAADSSAVTTTTNTANTVINAGGSAINTPADAKYDVDVTPSLTATAASTVNGQTINGSITGNITASYNGQSYTGTLDTKNGKVSVADSKGTAVTDFSKLTNGSYTVTVSGVSFNFGTPNANKTITLGSKNSNVKFAGADGKFADTVKVELGQNGTLTTPISVQVSNVNALDLSNANGVNFYNASNGSQVHEGSVNVTAGLNGRLNVSTVASEILKNFAAYQVSNGKAVSQMPDQKAVVADVNAALKAANNPVDNAGWFTAPTSFSVNVKATSSINGVDATLPVTVNVANGKDTTVPSQPKTIMHNAYYYDKNAKRVGTDKVTRYNTVTVATSTTKIGDKTYYEVVENGKLSGKFINADNIDGTKRTLKHNAYVYKSSKKRANKVVLKKGEEVTTYGGTYTFKNGKQYYKIGNDTKKTYVKASNF
ncbi:SLAP domain-containing protein [Lactobacillus crispatus]|uniref:SLAP domain-containing protein n=1 Tax=Lactobacillus crispatus TaxID=47770 RepID=UPI001192FCCB|nr:SLAP domain-containing protein [Lactobacillus crispatus]KAA8813731.1 S-layer protein [Lactobacillus crispatus]MDT9604822.1 SLAP domain-containing protein [Lactobacillus crispatus]MDX5061974.1 SLAP domain-containing protein [Lactobacillus crispatus]MDX5088991.1 SLAP domain-containing protein [Lactobacillus crispatus]MDX5090963.1 SLAP domain-containing protein [Lactobacillus crispatus]